MENYINDYIILPLHNAIHGNIYFNLYNLRSALDYCIQEDGMEVLHEKMKPYYKMYLEVNPIMFKRGACWDVRSFILVAMKEDDLFVEWFADNVHLGNIVYSWAKFFGKEKYESNEFMSLLLCFLVIRLECEWESHVNDLRNILLREEVEGNQYSRSVYCMFHAFVMIGKTKRPQQEKIDLYKKFLDHWFFLRFLYSAMFRCVIGCGFTNFVQIPNQIKSRVDYHPFAHLFYAATMEQKYEICKRGAKRDKLESALADIREISSKEPSDELNELCGILFPKVWKDYINKHRPKTYQELEYEVHTLRSNLEKNANEMQSLIDKQVEMLSETSIPIEVIHNELQNLSERFPGMAYEVYEKLNALLIKNEAWTKNAAKIRDMILVKMQQPTVQANNYYAAGASHNDYQKHLHITNDKKQIG